MSNPSNVYLVRAGKFGQDEDTALETGLAIIGFDDVPSMENVKDVASVQELLTNVLPDAKPGTIANFARQLWAFVGRMAEGDIVVLPRKGTSQIALGRVAGTYQYKKIDGHFRHTRPVKWIRQDVPRTVFAQDLLYSFGAFMTVCRVSRHNAAERVTAVLAGKDDPGPTAAGVVAPGAVTAETGDDAEDAPVDLAQAAHDQIVKHIQSQFSGHALSALVAAVLRADGWVTKESPPGPDGGVDILCGRGPLGLDPPRLCVQVKSQNTAADVSIYRTLQGSMQTFNAQQGLLVCWGGFNKVTLREARQGYFTVRLWDASDLVKAIYRTYENLPEEVQTDLPLKRVWTLVPDDEET